MPRLERSLAQRWNEACACLALALAAACGGDEVATEPLDEGTGVALASSKTSLALEQCANATTGAATCSWQSADLSIKNAAYAEGDVVPFRASIRGLTPGTQYTMTLTYDFTVAGRQAYDFLDTYDATEEVDVCGTSGRTSPAACAGGPLLPETSWTTPIGLDPFTSSDTDGNLSVQGAQGAASGVFRMWGVSALQAVYLQPLAHTGSTDAGSTAAILVTFTAAQTNPLLVWGGHLASGAYWVEGGQPDGAGAIVKGSWKMRVGPLTANGAPTVRNNVNVGIQPSAVQ